MEPPPLPTPTTSSQPSNPLSTDVSPPPTAPSQPQPQPPPPPSAPSQPQQQPESEQPSASALPHPQLQPTQPPNLSSSSPVPIPIPIPIPNANPNSIPTNSLSPFPQHPPGPPNNRGQPPFSRPWSQPTSQFSHFPSQFHSAPPSASTSSSSSPSPSLPPPRGVIAIGVPAHHPSPPPSVPSQPPASFSSSFGAQYVGGLPRYTSASVSDPSIVSSSSPSPARPPMQGLPSMGMIGSQIRPGGVPPSSLHQQRPVQAPSGIRPQAASNSLPSAPQNFQGGHGMLRTSSVTPSTSMPNTSQSQQSSHQPWLSAPQGRPPLPSQSIRPQVNSQSLQQRSHIPQQSPQPSQAAPQPQQLLPSPQQQQQFPASNQSQDNHGQKLPSSKVQQPLANQQQIVRVQGAANQRPPLPAAGQASVVQSGPSENSNANEISESSNTILSKRNIQELMNQIDPYDKLDPEVEDVLVDIAEDFIDSVTTFGCSLAKHRKSNTLEAKDILLHLERTWNMTLPGFSGDEIKTYKKPVANDIHKERLALIKKSLAVAEAGSNKSSAAGPAAGNVKGHLAKATTNIVGS